MLQLPSCLQQRFRFAITASKKAKPLKIKPQKKPVKTGSAVNNFSVLFNLTYGYKLH
jgi:hypothetical protein